MKMSKIGNYVVGLQEGKTRHGGPYDRGTADSYYGRGHNPHYYEGGTGTSAKIEQKDMTVEEIKLYDDGYEDNDKMGHFKDWGDDFYDYTEPDDEEE
tara:strand:+ start:5831 stop:6121 length:291 start_codon:yes stop_codon:yes gene_type:complete